MTTLQLILLTGSMALLTFLLRISFFLLHDRFELPRLVQETLRYAPAAVLMGLTMPVLLRWQGEISISAANPRLWAGLVAAIVARWRKNIPLTILCGMGTLWLLEWVMGGG